MTNSIFLNLIINFWNSLVNIFENSYIYKIFNKSSNKTNSIIVRELMDGNISENSNTYNFLYRLLESNTLKRENTSIFLKAAKNPFNSSILTLIIAGIFLFIIYLLKLFDMGILFLIICILIPMLIFFQYIVENKLYKGSLIYKFFNYAYKLEGEVNGK